jgi:hypothetical protein
MSLNCNEYINWGAIFFKYVIYEDLKVMLYYYRARSSAQFLEYLLTVLSRIPSSGMWRRVDLMWTDVSEEHVSIFRVEKSVSEEPAWAKSPRWFFAHRFFYPEDGGVVKPTDRITFLCAAVSKTNPREHCFSKYKQSREWPRYIWPLDKTEYLIPCLQETVKSEDP